MKKGFVQFVGVGPGNLELITVKAIKCLQKADVVISEGPLNPRFLKYINPSAEKIQVGKKKHHKEFPQDEVNQLLLDLANNGKHVVFFKGGDPCFFGRSSEEANFLKANGVSFSFVPGVTSAIASPIYAGIPLTHRGYTTSVAFISGHVNPRKDVPIKWNFAASIDTIVFLMGISNLSLIANELIKHGRSPLTPVALIYSGTRPTQKTLVGNLENIAELAEKHNFKEPSIIVVGDSVNLKNELDWHEKKPLFGKKFILVTEQKEDFSNIAELLEENGGWVIELPLFKDTALLEKSLLDKTQENLQNYQWLVFPNRSAVRFFFERLFEKQKDARSLGKIKLCTLNDGATEELKKFSLFADSEDISSLKGQKNLVVTADNDKFLQDKLQTLEVLADTITAYYRWENVTDREEIRSCLEKGDADYLILTTPQTAIYFSNYDLPLNDIKIACLGTDAEKTAKEFGLRVTSDLADLYHYLSLQQ